MTRVRRGVLLAGLIGVAVAAALVGVFFGSRIRSPAEVAAEARPPEPSNITVEVTLQVLSADVITRGDVVYDEPVQISLSGAFAETTTALVVTQSVEVDTELDEGDVAVAVTGRPVFLLRGEIPMYRDLRPGAEGEDVLQIEQALERLGFFDGPANETWDAATGAAIEAWYADAGYQPNGPSAEDVQLLAAARDRVRSAEASVADAEAALVDAQAGPDRSTLLAAGAEVSAAEDALTLARLDATHAETMAERAVDTAQGELQDANRALRRSETRLERARDGTHPDTGAPPTRQEMAVLRQDVADAEEMVTAAETVLAEAEFEVIRSATEQRTFLTQARQRLDIARASLSDLNSGGDNSALQRQVQLARDEVQSARTDRNALEAEMGTWLPAAEIVFLPRLPVRVDAVGAARGSTIEGSFLTVSGSEVALRTSVLERDAALLEEGMSLEMDAPDGGEPIPGTITFIATSTGTEGVANDRIYVEGLPSEIPDGLIGSNVRVRIPVSSTGGEVLAVPAAALFATASGTTQVEVEDDDGTLRTVVVEPGLAAGGLVQVTPTEGDLEEGDLVVVGREPTS